jgi:hypothetical protein
MVKRWRPHRIVVGGFSPNTHRLAEQVKQLVFDPEWVKAQKEAGKPVREEGGFDARDHEKPVPVNYVQDAVARISSTASGLPKSLERSLSRRDTALV